MERNIILATSALIGICAIAALYWITRGIDDDVR